ncbi:MAG TPA: YkgJ family cysteine cluster protein [Anaerolineae bacterium]|nr:YkgJ family cysteine cluster protein [Anaerolineae bacterium]
MDVWIVENGQLVLYKRSGECNQCGECCCAHTIEYQMSVSFKSQKPSADEAEDDDWSNSEEWSALQAQGVWWWFKVIEITDEPRPCPAYDSETRLCTIWQDMEKFRPICRYWPWNPKDITKFERCSFEFEQVEDNA